MKRALKEPVKGAEDYMKCDPSNRDPAGPVVAAEHECAADNRHELGEFDPDTVGGRRRGLVEVVNKTDHADTDIHAREDQNRQRTLVRIHGFTHGLQRL